MSGIADTIPLSLSTASPELRALREQIDALDDKLLALLIERTAIVKKVGEYKAKTDPGKCPLRPGREAEQLRRVISALKDKDFDPAAASAMWRMIIMASLQVEGEITVSAFSSEKQREYYWMAREYFGPFTPMLKQPAPKRALGDVIDGKAQIAVLPMLQQEQDNQARWWTDIADAAAKDRPKIFAMLPFVTKGKPSREVPTALAVGRVEPEPSGDDLSYLVIDAEEGASLHGLQTAFAKAQLGVRWIEVLMPVASKRLHLVEVNGFIRPEDEVYKNSIAPLGSAIISTVFLGAVAAPVAVE